MKTFLAGLALALFSNVAMSQITTGDYIRPDGTIVTVTVTAPAPTSGFYTVTVSDSGGDATDSEAGPTGNAPGEVESFGGENGITTRGQDPEGNPTTGGTYRGDKGKLQEYDSKTGKWKGCRRRPNPKPKEGAVTLETLTTGGAGTTGTLP